MKLAHAAFILLLLGASSPAEAHRFEAPDTIMALPGGGFQYFWAFTAVADTATVGDKGWSGITNTPPGVITDCRCMCTVVPGQQVYFEVRGSLTNPALPGRVQNWMDNCSGWTHENFTVILPFSRPRSRVWRVTPTVPDSWGSATPALPASWGAVKARYHGPRMAPARF